MTQPYRGPDRRGTVSAEPPSGWGFAVGAVGVAAAGVAEVAGVVVAPRDLVSGALAVLAMAAAGLCWLRWRELGDAAALWLGAGLLPTAAALLTPAPEPGLHVAGAASVLAAALVREVDARLRGAWLFVVPSVVAAGLSLLPVPGSAAVAGWLVAAVALLLRGVSSRPGLLWFALAAGGLAARGALGSGLVAAAGLAVAVLGLLRGVRRVIGVQRDQLFDAAVAALRAQALVEAATHSRERIAHDVDNALTALTGAALTLDRHADRLDDETREILRAGMRRELDRLHALVGEPVGEGLEVFEVGDGVRGYGRPDHTDEALRLLRSREEPSRVEAASDGKRTSVAVHGVSPDGLVLAVVRTLMTAQGGSLEPLEDGYALVLPAGPP